MAPDTTANEKIVLAKSYRAHEAGTIARPLGVRAASPRPRPGVPIAVPVGGAADVTPGS
jgi:hypothetical protein